LLCLTAVAGSPGCSVAIKSTSDPGGNFCNDSNCGSNCGIALRTLGRTLDPGVLGLFETSDRSGPIVELVAPNSPAARAGIVEGDRILSVDGIVVPLTHTTKTIWDGQGEHTVQLVRNGDVESVSVRAENLREVLLSAIYGDRSPNAARATVPMKPFVTGLNTRRIDGQTTIAAILPGSPADRAGLRAGDVITGVISSVPTLDALAWIEGADYRSEMTVQVMRSNHQLSYRIEMASVTELLRAAAGANNTRSVVSTY
jgi:S1-C subfamily serine protease